MDDSKILSQRKVLGFNSTDIYHVAVYSAPAATLRSAFSDQLCLEFAFNDGLATDFFSDWKFSTVSLICAGLFSFLCGESNESFAIPMAMAASAYAFIQHFRLTRMQWVCSVLLAAGLIVLIAAPGNWLRLNSIPQEHKHNIASIAQAFPRSRSAGYLTCDPVLSKTMVK